MDREERKALRKEIIKKLNRAKKIDLEVRKLKADLGTLLSDYFDEYMVDYSVCAGGINTDDGIYETMLAFVEDGEYGGGDLWKATFAKNGSEFMKNAEKWHKENGTFK